MPLSRRKFISTSAAFSGALIAPFQQENMTRPSFSIPPDFKIIVMATDWGYKGTFDDYCAKAKQEGYDGIELWWQSDPKKKQNLFDNLKKHNLEVGFLCGAHDYTFSKNLDQFKGMIEAASTQSPQKPLYINCHSGRDYFAFEENQKFIECTMEYAKKTGVPISHETHRARILYSAPAARKFMEAMPGLRITLDISHWCNVHESFLEGQDATVDMVLQRVDHIHARIGHPEGPQVSDPRAPEWETALNKHIAWWDKVVELKIKQGAKRMTFLAEFGPPDYLPTLPYTRQPLADQWGINVHMMQLLKKRYSGK